MISVIFAAAVLLAEATPAAAPAPAADAAKAAKSTVVCHREEITGTRLSKKICETVDDGEAGGQKDKPAASRTPAQAPATGSN